MTIYHFTCKCGNMLRVDAPSIFLANLGAYEQGWKVEIEPAMCWECKEIRDEYVRSQHQEL